MSALPQPKMPRASRWEWVKACLLVGNLGFTVLANGGLGGWFPVVTLVLTAALVAVHAVDGLLAGEMRPWRAHPAGWLLLPFLAYGLVHVWWLTPVRWLGWIDWLGWAQITAVFWVVLNGFPSRGPRHLIFHALVALGIACVLMGCYQQFVEPDWRPAGGPRSPNFRGRASGSFGIPNSMGGYLLLLLPAVAALIVRRTASAISRVWWIWVGLVLLLGLLLTLSRGAWLALGLALLVWPLVGLRGSWRFRGAMALLILLGLATAGTMAVAKLPWVRERMVRLVEDGGEVTRPLMWRGAWRLFCDAPLLGTGAGSYNILFERHRPERFRDEPVWAHNEYLNTLSDYGLVGFLLFFGGTGVVAASCLRSAANGRAAPSGPGASPPSRLRGPARAGSATHAMDEAGLREGAVSSRLRRSSVPVIAGGWAIGLLAFAFQMGVDFHLKVPALALASAVIAGLAVQATWRIPSRDGEQDAGRRRRRGRAWLAVVLSVGAVAWFRPILEAEGQREAARRTVDRLHGADGTRTGFASTLREARSRLESASAKDRNNARAWTDLAYVRVLEAWTEPERTTELGRAAEAAADRALQVGAAYHEAWIRRGVARDLQGRWLEAREDFVQALVLAPAHPMTWYHYAYHLSRRPAGLEQARGAVEFCLRLDPWNSAGLALRQQLASIPKAP